MAPYTYYYFFSILFLLAVAFHITNMLCFRINDKTLLSDRYGHETVEYQRLSRLSRTRNLAVAVLISLLLVANVIFAALRVASLHTADSAFILFFAPVATVIFSVVIVLRTQRKFSKNHSSRRS